MTRVDEITVYGRSFRTLFIGGFARLTDQDFHAAVDAARDYLARLPGEVIERTHEQAFTRMNDHYGEVPKAHLMTVIDDIMQRAITAKTGYADAVIVLVSPSE